MKQKKPSSLTRILGYAGGHKNLTILGCVLSALSAVLGLAPYLCVWLVARSVLGTWPGLDGAGELDVTRVKAYDPLHVISYNMLKLDKGSQMTFPTSNVSHFFRAQAASATSAVRITVTDEEGHEYVQTMERPKSLNYQMD